MVPAWPRLAETLACDWRKAARFCARFGNTKAQLSTGIRAEEEETVEDLAAKVRAPRDTREEVLTRMEAPRPSDTLRAVTL